MNRYERVIIRSGKYFMNCATMYESHVTLERKPNYSSASWVVDVVAEPHESLNTPCMRDDLSRLPLKQILWRRHDRTTFTAVYLWSRCPLNE
eukprot:scaffold3951_cov111-Skeletonema_dohrnii-CCMP3373.AAC.4